MSELPEFFQTTGDILFDMIESDDMLQPAASIDELVTRGLSIFFQGVPYSAMDDFFYSFEGGNTWMSNPVFSDEFTVLNLPFRLKSMLYELNDILNIRGVISEELGPDCRYWSLCDSQQDEIRNFIRNTPSKYCKLDDIYNRFNGYRERTPHPEIKFLLNRTIDVVQDILQKPIEN